MVCNAVVSAAWLAIGASGQQVGTNVEESHLAFKHQECTTAGGCSEQPGSVVLDMQWRWLHASGTYKNCLGAKEWDPTFCPGPEACSRACEVEGLTPEDYSQTYGVDPQDGGVKLHYVAPKGNVASRVYLLQDEKNYRMFHLKNREFSVTVDVSSLGCGLNGAVYFVEMPQNGGQDGDLNTAGAKYGTGYCDAQCPRGLKFVEGAANLEDMEMIEVMTPELELKKVGPVARHGACCAEMDIFEANNKASSFTAHPCANAGTFKCAGDQECGDKRKGYLSQCDKNGCGMNSYQLGNREFFGEGKQVDSKKPVTLVTQFITSDNTDYGDLVEIRRLYIQDGKVIENFEAMNIAGHPDSIKDGMCDAMAQAFNESAEYNFKNMGGLKAMGDALDRGMVLTMSIWDDSMTRMLWLDGVKGALDKQESVPGVTRGTCPFESGVAKTLHKESKDSYVIFKDVKVGEIGSTYQGAAPAKKYSVIDDAAKAWSAQASGRLSLTAAAGVFGLFISGTVLLAVATRTRRLQRLRPAAQSDEEDLLLGAE